MCPVVVDQTTRPDTPPQLDNASASKMLLGLSPFRCLCAISILLLSTRGTTGIVDLSKPWQLSPLYNGNAAYCAIQSRLAEPVIGYVVVKDGLIVAEGYTGENKATDLNAVWSTTKSWTNLLIGRLVAAAQLQLDWTLGQIFSDDQVWAAVVDAEDKKSITLRELLTMTGGLEDDSQVDIYAQETLTDVLNQFTFSSQRRGQFKYVAFNQVLSRIIFQVTGMTPFQFAADSGVFDALGMNATIDFSWDAYGGVEGSAFGLRTNPRVNAKLGLLHLQNGVAAEGLQLVDSAWMASSVSNQLPKGVSSAFPIVGFSVVYHGYGYQWWTAFVDQPGVHHPEAQGAYAALGLFGQLIGVFPQTNTVVSIVMESGTATVVGEAISTFLGVTVSRNLKGLDERVGECNWKNQHGILETIKTIYFATSLAIHKFLEMVWAT